MNLILLSKLTAIIIGAGFVIALILIGVMLTFKYMISKIKRDQPEE